MPEIPVIVSLATAWGSKHGGINAFNLELMRSLGIQPCRSFDLCCVVLDADAEASADAERYKVELIPLSDKGKEFPSDASAKVRGLLVSRTPGEGWVWIGHDTASGELALQLRHKFPGSRVVLFHHMAFCAYQDYKKGSSETAAAKREQQRRMFAQANLCVAVGPMLQHQLKDLLQVEKKKPPIVMVVPGLAEPEVISDQPPNNFTAFVAGRLGGEDDRIKQGVLAVRGLGAALAEVYKNENYLLSHIRKSPTLRMRGIPEAAQPKVRKLLESAAERVLNCDLADYGENREAYFRDLASSSVAMMPSWHEGFGLVAWEAIACQVPVIIGEHSGVYRLLSEVCQRMGLGRSVRSIAVQGHLAESDEEPNHTEHDVETVRDAVIYIGDHISDRKADAVTLANNLRRCFGYTWEHCARDFLKAVESHMGIRCYIQPAERIPPPACSPPDAAGSPRAASARSTPDVPPFMELLRPRYRWGLPSWYSPSDLLVARDQIVPFDPERNDVVDFWLAWIKYPAARHIGLRLVTGPGGMGKTRSALELLNRAERLGWLPLWLGSKLPEDWVATWKNWLLDQRGLGTRALLVVDYAEGRQETLLRLLDTTLTQVADSAGSFALRVLLLARGDYWWQELPHHTACTEDVAVLLTGAGNASSEALPRWNDDVQVRERTYLAALSAYAEAHDLATPPHPYKPNFAAKMYDRPLYLHMAAIATLAGERPTHLAALLDSQLRREWRYWEQSGLAPEACYDDWADALAWLALVQGATVEQTTSAFASLGIAAPGLSAGLARAYPADDGAIVALQPDTLAEALIIERLAAQRGSLLIQAALPEDPSLAVRTLQVIGRLAAKHSSALAQREAPKSRWQQALCEGLTHAWPKHAQRLVDAAHEAEPGLGQLICEAWRRQPEDAQEAIAPGFSLPHYSTPLLTLTVEVKRARLRIANNPAQRAAVLNNLSISLFNLGDATSRTEALAFAREAVGVYRELAQAQPAAYRPDLAKSLNNLANCLSAQGDATSRTEALACAREALEIRRELVPAQPAVDRPDLAKALNSLAIHLSEQGDADSRTEALACARKALEIRRELAQAQPAAYLPDLAGSLNNLATHLSAQGDAASRTEALACAREALEIRRELAQAQPAAYLPDLAVSLTNLANHLSEQGDATSRTEVLACAREAVGVYRELAQAQPAAYRSGLAAALNNLASHLSEQGDATSRTEALACAREAVGHYALLNTQMPDAFERNLWIAVVTLKHAAHTLGLDAEDELREALTMFDATGT